MTVFSKYHVSSANTGLLPRPVSPCIFLCLSPLEVDAGYLIGSLKTFSKTLKVCDKIKVMPGLKQSSTSLLWLSET